jgi:hypothetical protein
LGSIARAGHYTSFTKRILAPTGAGISLALFRTTMGRFIVVIFALTICASRSNGAIFPDSGPTTPGPRASLCGGIALAPAQAPLAVKRAILGGKSIALEAVSLRWRPLLLSRQRLRLFRNCFVCSWWCGLVSSPMSSSDFRRYGQRGQGRRITVYTRNGHTFAVIAGLRLDTTPGDSSRYRWAPRWQTTFRGPAGFEARHPVGL